MRRSSLLVVLLVGTVVVGIGTSAHAGALHGRVPEGMNDFNGDGFADLAVGVPGEGVNGKSAAGALNVLYGGPGGLSTTGNQFWSQDSANIVGSAQSGDGFGSAVATGDFDGDGFGDVAVGIPGKDVDGRANAGAVAVLYGSFAGLTSTGNQNWTQNSPNIEGEAEPGDAFGSSVAAGDFGGDGFADLAVGVPGEGVASASTAGAVNVIDGAVGGLTSTGDQFWAQDVPGVLDVGETADQFGFSVAAGDLDADGFADLAIGVPFENVGSVVDAGAVNVLYGANGGLSTSGNQFWNQNSAGILDLAESSDHFGWDLATGNFGRNGNEFGDLAVGVPQEGVGTVSQAGAVNVLYGTSLGLTSDGNQFWTQNSTGILDQSETADQFGLRVAAGDFDGDGNSDLVVGAPFENIGSVTDGGSVNVLYGGTGGLSSTGNQFWSQDSTGIQGDAESLDDFSKGLAVGDYDGTARDDLSVGVPGESLASVNSAGSVNTLYGQPAGLSSAGNQFWSQDNPGMLDQAEAGDVFGSALG